jgi:hypothetical protein
MKFKTILSVRSWCTFSALAMSVQLPAQELIRFDAPGAATVSSPTCAGLCGTTAFANNNAGDIVGSFTDTNVVPHGFLRRPDGRIISFDAPGAGLGAGLDQGTIAYGINDLGVIAGQFQDAGNVFHGFVRFPDGSFATFEAPGAGTGAYQGTVAYNINLEGATAGVYFDGSNVEHGFVRSHTGEITTFDPPDSVGTMVCEETCLNLEGAITGFFQDASNTIHGFVRDTRLKVASGVSTFPDWNRECRSASVVGQAVPPARPRLTNPTAPRMPPTQPTPDCPQCSGPSDLSAVGCVPSDRKTHPARRVVRIVPTIGSPVARSRTSTSTGWREQAPRARSTDAHAYRATTVGRSQGGPEHDPPPRRRGRV